MLSDRADDGEFVNGGEVEADIVCCVDEGVKEEKRSKQIVYCILILISRRLQLQRIFPTDAIYIWGCVGAALECGM